MVESLWAMAIVVLVDISLSRASCTIFSDSVSSDAVASSRIRIGGFLRIALAMLILCLWPPDSLMPRSPMLKS